MNLVGNSLVFKLAARDVLSEQEISYLSRGIARVVEFSPGENIVREGESPDHSSLMISGFSARCKYFDDGNRQITALHIAGDFVDLHCYLLRALDHSIIALTGCRVALFRHEALTRITEDLPHLTRLLWLSTVIDAAIHRQWLAVNGRLNAEEKIAHLLCEMNVRLQVVGLSDGRSFMLPLRQADIADLLGLSVVHINRVIQKLKQRNLILWKNQKVTILGIDELIELAQFDATYLNIGKKIR